MERGRGRGLAAALIVLGTIGGVLASRAEAGLAIVQRSNGLPGTSSASVTQQKLFVGTGKLRLDDVTVPKARSIIIRLDKGVVWELDHDMELYTETKFEHYKEQRQDAEAKRERAREQALEKLSGADLDAWLAKNGVRKDGKRIVEVKRGPWEVTGGTRLQRVAIELNGVTQVAVWQTDKYRDEYKAPKELFEFYDKVGAFPDDVAAELKKAFDLFPLRIYANIDLFSAGAVIETRVEAIAHWPEEPERFEVPSNYKLVKEFPKEKIARKAYRCPVCKKAIEDPREAQFSEKDKRTGEKVFLDSEECWKEFLASGRRTKPE